jgi:hypothetical protein
METTKQNSIIASFTILGIILAGAFCTQQSVADPNGVSITKLGEGAKKIGYLVESMYWPALNYSDVNGFVSEPNSKKQGSFVKVIREVVDSNYLPEKLGEKTRFLKGWRDKGNENFVVQYEKNSYLIRIKNKKTTVVASRKWTSHWITIAIQLKDKATCVNKSNLNSILNYADAFLNKKVNSKSQNYSGVKNVEGAAMERPVFQKIDENYIVGYPVQSSKPDIDYVSIWTDGHIVVINLQERQKVVLDKE